MHVSSENYGVSVLYNIDFDFALNYSFPGGTTTVPGVAVSGDIKTQLHNSESLFALMQSNGSEVAFGPLDVDPFSCSETFWHHQRPNPSQLTTRTLSCFFFFFFFLDPAEINEDDNHYVNVLEDMWQYMNLVFDVS